MPFIVPAFLVAPGGPRGENPARERLASLLEIELAAQKDRLILWAPVCLGTGVACYFGLPFEPNGLMTGLVMAVAVAIFAAAWPLRAQGGTKIIPWLAAAALFLFALGFTAAKIRTAELDTMLLKKDLGPVTVTGTVAGIDVLEPDQGLRMTLGDLQIERLTPERTPQRVRLKVRRTGAEIYIGDRVQVLARLTVPAAPAAPRSFDFQRYAYFQHMGAYGFTYKAPEILSRSTAGSGLESLRQTIVRRIEGAVPFPNASVVMALMIGARAAVPESDMDAMRGAGLAHMLAISGLHVGLVAGSIFFFSRLLMAAFPLFALRHPIKKYAAVLAFAGALFYTLIAGATIPTVRAMTMTGIVLLAVVIDRKAISLRSLAIAALAILLVWPEALWGASFQMSFAAVAGLIVAYEALTSKWGAWYREAGWVRRLALYFLGICLTSLVATLVTAPFSLYNFQQFTIYSIPGNLLTMPVLAYVVMPAAVLAYLLMPLHGEGLALKIMAWGVKIILYLAHNVASWPGAMVHAPVWPVSVLALFSFSGMIFLFWRGRGKFLCAVPLLAALAIAVPYRTPDILVAGDAGLIAVKDARGQYELSSRVAGRFAAQDWLRANAQDDAAKWPHEGSDEAGLTCGEEGCRLERDGRKIAFSFAPSSQGEDCAWADVLIALKPLLQKDCRAGLVVDRFDLWRGGAQGVWFDGRHESVEALRGKRPWTVSNGR